MKVRIQHRRPWIAVAIVAAAILVISVIPVPESVPEDGGGVPTSLLFHFFGYATLAALLSVALSIERSRVRAIPSGALAASVYGALIECLQYPIPYRTFSYFDVLVNATGAGVGVLVVAALLVLREAP